MNQSSGLATTKLEGKEVQAWHTKKKRFRKGEIKEVACTADGDKCKILFNDGSTTWAFVREVKF